MDIREWKKALGQCPVDPALVIFDNAKFSRLMKGRLYFYANAPGHFDFTWLIQNELRRIGGNFFVAPFRAYWKARTGETVQDPATILARLRGDPLADDELECTREFARLTTSAWQGRERETAMAVVQVFYGFFSALTQISESALKMTEA